MSDDVIPTRSPNRPGHGSKPRVKTGSGSKASKVSYDPAQDAAQIAAFLRERGPTICDSRPARGAIPERLFEG